MQKFSGVLRSNYEITPQLEAQGAMDQLPVYQEIFQAEAEYEVYQEFDVVE